MSQARTKVSNLGFRSEINRKSKIENRPRGLKWLGLSVIAFVLVVVGATVNAQQAGKVPRIGYLHFGAGPIATDEAFQWHKRGHSRFLLSSSVVPAATGLPQGQVHSPPDEPKQASHTAFPRLMMWQQTPPTEARAVRG